MSERPGSSLARDGHPPCAMLLGDVCRSLGVWASGGRVRFSDPLLPLTGDCRAAAFLAGRPRREPGPQVHLVLPGAGVGNRRQRLPIRRQDGRLYQPGQQQDWPLGRRRFRSHLEYSHGDAPANLGGAIFRSIPLCTGPSILRMSWWRRLSTSRKSSEIEAVLPLASSIPLTCTRHTLSTAVGVSTVS